MRITNLLIRSQTRHRRAVPPSKSRKRPVRGPTCFHPATPSPRGGCFADMGAFAARIGAHHKHTPPFEIPSNPAKPEPNPIENNNRQHIIAFHDMRLTNYSNEPRASLSFSSSAISAHPTASLANACRTLWGRELNPGPLAP